MTTVPPKSLPPMTVLDSGTARYTIRSVIGSGGFGITYKASTRLRVQNINAMADVAIKELFIAADSDRTVLANGETTVVTSGPARERVKAAMNDFIAEANRLRSLSGTNHNIVNVNEVFTANGTAYYVMEYLDGPSLHDYVQSRGKLTEAEMLRVMLPLVHAVVYLHSRRIMHLDIKPGNVVMAREDNGSMRPVLIDFGQSKHYDRNGEVTNTVSAAGLSEGYAPIEQYAGIKSFSPWTDVYALAATMLYCLTGQKPPRAMDLTPSYLGRALAGVSPRVAAALAGALALQPGARTQSAEAFAAALVGHSMPSLPRQPLPQPSRRSTTWVLWGGIALLAAALGAVGVLLAGGSGSETSAADVQSVTQDVPQVEDVVPSTEPVREAVEPREAPAAEAPMYTYHLTGYFSDSSGQQWPVKLTMTTNGEGKWGKCVYTNVTYGIVLNMQGSGSDGDYRLYTNEQGADLTIRISGGGEGIWDGTATSGSKTLNVYLQE